MAYSSENIAKKMVNSIFPVDVMKCFVEVVVLLHSWNFLSGVILESVDVTELVSRDKKN